MIQFICYPKCTTCQKAKKWLDDNKIEYEFRDIKADNPSLEELSVWYKMSELPLKKFFNTSGLLYKSMELKDKLPNMSEEDQLKLLATDGMLVKRPLIIGKDFVLVGFKESEWSDKLSLILCITVQHRRKLFACYSIIRQKCFIAFSKNKVFSHRPPDSVSIPGIITNVNKCYCFAGSGLTLQIPQKLYQLTTGNFFIGMKHIV